MSAKINELHRVIDRLDEKQLDALYTVAICFMARNDFDYISPEESDAINRSFEEIRRGECIRFESSGEMAAHFRVQ